MKGERNEHWGADARSRVPCVIRGRLYDTGWGYPAFVPDDAGQEVAAELLDVTPETLARIDVLEGYPRLFIRMLLHSEERGPHASGLAWLKTDGSHQIFKRPMRAHELVYEKPFQELLGQVDNETTILMGHTRWRTRGNEFNNRNNHPIRAGIVIGTHNGTIYNADYLFRRLRLPRYAEVDSELIFRLADRFAPEGPIDQEGLKKALALCRGQMSAVLASRLDPGTITVLKGNKPLCLRIHRQYRVVLYASEPAFIDFAVDNEKGWRELGVPPMTMLTIRHADVRAIENSEFRFIPQERKGTLPEGVNA